MRGSEINMEQLRERKDIEEEFRWSTESMFASDSDWDEEFQKIKEVIDSRSFTNVQGHLQDGSHVVLDYLQRVEELERRLGILHIYAHMKNDQDTREQQYQAILSRVQMVAAIFSEQVSFFEPELLSLPQTLLDDYVQSAELSEYRHLMDNIVRHKPHILSGESEALPLRSQ